MRPSLNCASIGSVLAALLATALVAQAQTPPAPAPETPPAAAPASTTAAPGSDQNTGDVVNLKEFDVTGEKTTGYQAANSISATGIGTAIYDVPLPVFVVTHDLLQDTAAVDMRDAVQNIPGITTDPRDESAFSMRGFAGNIAYRDGFYRRQNYQTWDMDRIEVIEGPAAIFFGTVRPGGIINYVTARASFDGDFGELGLEGGSESLERGSFVYNYVLSPEVAARISLGSLNSNNLGAQYDFLNEDHASIDVTLKPTSNQNINIYVDKERRNDYLDEHGYALSNPLYLGNPAAIASGENITTWMAANHPGQPVLTEFAPIFPANDVYGRSYSFNTDNFEKFSDWDVDLDYVIKINDHMVWETAASRGQDDQPGLRAESGDETPFADGHVNFVFEYFENDRNSINMNNKYTVKFDVGPLKNTLQISQQFQEVTTFQPGYISPSGSFSTNNLSATIVNFYPKTSAPLSNDLARIFANQPINDWETSKATTAGQFIADQISTDDDKLHILIGERRDVNTGSVYYNNNTVTVVNHASSPGHGVAWNPQFGAIYEIIPGLSVYATESKAVEPQNGDVDVFGNVAGPVQDLGYDTGIKTDFLGGKISTDVEYFYLRRADIASTDTARELATGLSPLYIFGTTNQSNGISTDANLVLGNLQLLLGYQHMLIANITNAPPASAGTIGEPLADTPTNTGSAFAHYTFRSGELRGLALGLGGRYSGSAPIASATNETVRDPAFIIYNGSISLSGYKIFGYPTRYQFNVQNLTNKVYHDGVEGFFGFPRKFLFSTDTKF